MDRAANPKSNYLILITGALCLMTIFFIKPYHSLKLFSEARVMGLDWPIINGLVSSLIFSTVLIFISRRLRYYFWDFLFILFIIYSLSSTIWATNGAFSLASTSILITSYFSYCVWRYLFKSNQEKESVIHWALLLFFILFLAGYYFINSKILLQFVSGESSFMNYTMSQKSFVGGKNYTGIFLALVLPYIFLLKNTNLPRLLIYFSLGLGVVTLLLIGSRNAYLGSIIFISLSFLLTKYRALFDRKNLIRFMILLPALMFLFMVSTITDYLFKNWSLFERSFVWTKSFSIFKSNNILSGIGQGNWPILQDQNLENYSHYVVHPHNDFLTILCELGFVGIMLYSLIIAATIYYSIQLLINSKQSNNPYYRYAFAYITSFLVMANIDSVKINLSHFQLVLICFAFVKMEYSKHIGRQRVNPDFQRLIRYLIVLLALFSIGYSVFLQNEFMKLNRVLSNPNICDDIHLKEFQTIDNRLINVTSEGPIYNSIANCYYERDLDEKGNDYSNATLKLFPYDKDSRLALAKYHDERKEYQEAIKYWAGLVQYFRYADNIAIKKLNSYKKRGIMVEEIEKIEPYWRPNYFK